MSTMDLEREMWVKMTKHLESLKDCISSLEERASVVRLENVVSCGLLSDSTLRSFEEQCWERRLTYLKREFLKCSYYAPRYIHPDELDKKHKEFKGRVLPSYVRKAIASLSDKKGEVEIMCRILIELIEKQIIRERGGGKVIFRVMCKKLRAKQGLTREELAKELCISQVSMWRVENGGDLDLETFEKVNAWIERSKEIISKK